MNAADCDVNAEELGATRPLHAEVAVAFLHLTILAQLGPLWLEMLEVDNSPGPL